MKNSSHCEHDQHCANTIIKRMQNHTRPDGACVPAQEGKSEANEEEYRKRSDVSMRHRKDQRTKDDSSHERHATQQTHEHKTAKENLLTKRGNQHASNQRG